MRHASDRHVTICARVMTLNVQGEVTRLLDEISGGDRYAADELIPLVYAELKKLAHSRLARERPGHTLQTTALVHEAYLRLVGSKTGNWENRAHFFGAAAEAMRRILVERARRVARLKRGGDWERVDLLNAPDSYAPRAEELLALNEALERLEANDRQMATVIKLRYLVGFSVEETAEALGLSPRTVNRHWDGGRAWLLREMTRKKESG